MSAEPPGARDFRGARYDECGSRGRGSDRLRCADRLAKSTSRGSEGQRAKGRFRAIVRKRKPKLGQHFLASEDAAARIVDALGDVSQSTVLEIGPGRGILTSLLARRARRLIAVELDRVLAAQLRLKFGMSRNVEIIEGDVLAIDFDSLFGPKPGLGRPGNRAQAAAGEGRGQSSLLHYVGHSAAAV